MPNRDGAAWCLVSGNCTGRPLEGPRRYQDGAGDGLLIIGTLCVQQWALRKLAGGDLPEHVTITVDRWRVAQLIAHLR